jgi:hypothetical protein
MMSKGHRIRDILTSEENYGILYEDMDEALIGIHRTQEGLSLGIYSYIKYTELLIKNGMLEEDAVECADSYVAKGIISVSSSYPLIIDDTGV